VTHFCFGRHPEAWASQSGAHLAHGLRQGVVES
jgi:hypothetical protein